MHEVPQEVRRNQQLELTPVGSFFDQDDDESTGGMVTVSHAPYAEDLPVGEMSVREVRERFADRLDIHPDSVALLDGDEVGDDTIIHQGQRLMFVRPSGEKGARARGGPGVGVDADSAWPSSMSSPKLPVAR